MTIAWGIVATCAALINSRKGLFLQRFSLGITEAGALCSVLHNVICIATCMRCLAGIISNRCCCWQILASGGEAVLSLL
jgi:hypothetical protein